MHESSAFPPSSRISEPARTLLVVDDDPEAREMLSEMLRASGHSVETAEDGHAAVLGAALHPPDLILMDGDMPVLDGFEACRILKTHTNTRTVPVFIVTGLDDRRHRLGGWLGVVGDAVAGVGGEQAPGDLAEPLVRDRLQRRCCLHLDHPSVRAQNAGARWR